MARGYLNRSSLTSDRFIGVDLPGHEGVRLYRTGDLVKWLGDGNIVYLGRLDDQVKVRGFRIELGEIEHAILSSGKAVQAAVLALDREGIGQHLVGYVVLKDGYSEEDVKGYLEGELPGYMVPQVWVALAELPVTSNGKIDKGRLPEPDHTPAESYEAPSTETEKKLAAIWEELLDVEKVGVHDNFFELGGNSLLATRVISNLRKQFDREIVMKDIFRNPTISSLSALLSEVEEESKLPLVEKAERPLHIPLSYSQERLWFIDQLQGSIHYHMPYTCLLKGPLDKDSLEGSLLSIVSPP